MWELVSPPLRPNFKPYKDTSRENSARIFLTTFNGFLRAILVFLYTLIYTDTTFLAANTIDRSFTLFVDFQAFLNHPKKRLSRLFKILAPIKKTGCRTK